MQIMIFICKTLNLIFMYCQVLYTKDLHKDLHWVHVVRCLYKTSDAVGAKL